MLRFQVLGVPAPQGSKTRMPNGALVEAASTTGRAKVKAWRQAVAETAYTNRLDTPLDGPLSLQIEFRLPRPKARRWQLYADRKPDVSKILRATEDALTDAGLISDDARICRLVVDKFYSDPYDPWTGAWITVTPLEFSKPTTKTTRGTTPPCRSDVSTSPTRPTRHSLTSAS